MGAAFGWGWLLELLEVYGFEPHMVHPLQCKAIASAQPIHAILADHGHGRRRGKKIATTPVARELITRAYHRLTGSPAHRRR